MSAEQRQYSSMYQRQAIAFEAFRAIAEADLREAERLMIRQQRLILEQRAIRKGWQK